MDKPNITIVYQDAKVAGPGFGTILLELLTFAVIAFIVVSCH